MLNNIEVVAIEDGDIPPESVNYLLEKESSGYQFVWHEEAKAKVTSRKDFDKYKQLLSGKPVEGWGRLERGLLFIDLKLGVPLQDKEKEKVMEWVGSPEEYFKSGEEAGVYLAGLAITNPNWSGIVVVASTSNYPWIVDSLQGISKKSDQVGVVWGSSLREPGYKQSYNAGIAAFLRKFGGIERRIWPGDEDGGDEINWFERSHDRVPHNVPSSGEKREMAKQEIRSYLEDLLLFEPPQSWFEKKQFDNLYDELKYLLGVDSTAHNDGSYNLTLGSLVVLVAAACGDKYARRWIDGIAWKKDKQQILPKQSKKQARTAALSLAKKGGLFHCLKKHKRKTDEDGDKKPIIEDVELRDNYLEITLDFDFTDETDGSSLRDKLLELPDPKNAGGDTYKAICEFIQASGVNEENNPERRCVLNWSQKEEEQTVLTIEVIAT